MPEINEQIISNTIEDSNKDIPKIILDIFGSVENFREAIKGKVAKYLAKGNEEILSSDVGPLPVLLGFEYAKLSRDELDFAKKILREVKEEMLPEEFFNKEVGNGLRLKLKNSKNGNKKITGNGEIISTQHALEETLDK